MPTEQLTLEELRQEYNEAIKIIRAAVSYEGYLMRDPRTPKWFLDARKFLVKIVKRGASSS
jgi:hypothetical protein